MSQLPYSTVSMYVRMDVNIRFHAFCFVSLRDQYLLEENCSVDNGIYIDNHFLLCLAKRKFLRQWLKLERIYIYS